MKNKIKLLLYRISVAILLVPTVAGAQFIPPTPGETGLPEAGILEIITNIMNWLLMAVGILGVIGFAIAGILYLTAAGDDDRISTAKNAMLYSIIGIVVAIAGLVAIRFAEGILGAQENF